MSNTERQRFTLFVQSPYFNKSDNCKKLLNEVLKNSPSFHSKKLEKGRLLKKVYPQAKSISILTTDLSRLMTLLEDFVIQENFINGQLEIGRAAILAEFYEGKEEYKLVKSVQQKQMEYYSKNTNGDDLFYLKMFSQMPSFIRSNYVNKNEAFLYLGQGFLKYVFLRLLKDECHYKASNFKYQITNALPLSGELINLLENKFVFLLEAPLIKIYYAYYKIYESAQSADSVNDFLELLSANLSSLNKEDKYLLFGAAINMCLKCKYFSELEKRSKRLEIYKIMIKENVLTKGKLLGIIRFMNIVSTAAYCGEYEWGDDFIEEHIKFIKEEDPINEVKYSSKAIIAFYKKDYEMATKFFQKCKVNLPPNQELPKKALELRCLYELKLWNDNDWRLHIQRLINRFERYLYNFPKGISIEMCEAYKSFFQLTRILFRYQTNQTSSSKKNIYEKIKKTSCINKDWILAKYNEL